MVIFINMIQETISDIVPGLNNLIRRILHEVSELDTLAILKHIGTGITIKSPGIQDSLFYH